MMDSMTQCLVPGGAYRLQLDGHLGASFTYIPVHIEFILSELLKNSMAYVTNSLSKCKVAVNLVIPRVVATSC